jgi:hypothetical protein
MTEIVDTNVILIANRQHPDVSETCVVACMIRLERIMRDGRVAIDDAFRILLEYQHKTTPHLGKRVGDVFVKWVLRNQANPSRCDRVPLAEHPTRAFNSFPDDPRLADFDAPDRKFVAVAAAHSDPPPIAQAADSKWLGWAPALQDHGIVVDFLCRDDIGRFQTAKKQRKGKKRP